MTKGRYSSNSDIFRRRGDPWVSRKEGVKDFGRNLETEDAEYDFDHRFHATQGSFGKPKQAVRKPEHRDPIPGRAEEPSFSQRKANILRSMNSKLNDSKFIIVKEGKK